MTSEQFDQLVNRIQRKYDSRPWALRWKIALIVALGYAGFLAILLVVLALSAALVMGAILAGQEPSIFLMAVVAVLLAFGLSQTLVFLWIPMEPQPGREVKREEVPRLYQLLDMLQSEFHVRPFQHVVITYEFNAAVQMIPRLGVFGLNRSYLYLGLPLMQALTPDQFAAVLAHEFAHSSSRHDRFGVWIYRLRQTWSRVFAALHDAPSGGWMQRLRAVILWFVDWYWPRFNAHAFVLSRADEYEADRLSAEWAGVDSAASALFRIDSLSLRLNDKFWPEIVRLAKRDEVVPDDILQRTQDYLASPPDPADASRWLEQASQALTGSVDTHPSVSDRLKALGQSVDQFVRRGFPSVPSETAAQVLLGDGLQTIAADVNQRWKKENSLKWQNLFHQARRLEKQLESPTRDPEGELATDPLQQVGVTAFDLDRLWQHARTIWELEGAEAAEPLLRQLLDQAPDHSLANVTLGRHLLERGQVEGELLLRRVLEDGDSELVPAACQGLIIYYQQLGQSEKLRETQSQLSRYEVSQQAAIKERASVLASDKFMAHELNEAELSTLKESLREQGDVDSAWLVKKVLRHFPRQRLFVLVVRSKPRGLFGTVSPDNDRILVGRLIGNVKLPGRVLVIGSTGGFRKLARKVQSTPGSQLSYASST